MDNNSPSILNRCIGFLKWNVVNFKRKIRFKPYVIKTKIEDDEIDFYIGDLCGEDWYANRKTTKHAEMRFIKDNIISEGEIIFDIGAHHGLHSVLYSKWTGKNGHVYSFEANPNNADIIEKNKELNNCNNISVFSNAVGSEEKDIQIKKVSNSFIGSGESKNMIKVKMVKLDDYIKLRPTYLKIDVEGYENEVLKGSKNILKTLPKLEIEIHTDDLQKYDTNVDEILNMIELNNYHAWIKWEHNTTPETYDEKRRITKRVHLFAIPKT